MTKISQFLQAVGDKDGTLTYTVDVDFDVTRLSKSLDDKQSSSMTDGSPTTEEEAKLPLWSNREALKRRRDTIQTQLDGVNREIIALDAVLGGYTPPSPPDNPE